MKTAVVYARYSSDSQSEQSIEGQLRVCQEYAKNNQILIVDTYIDRAMTGTNDLRPDFQRMIRDSSKRQWNYVIVYKLDRFSRNKYETTIHKHTLHNNGVKVLSAMENIPDTPEGIILESLLEGMNQYYSAELSQKVHRGLNESYLKGQFTGGATLYGYDVVNKKIVINPTESEIVKEIFTKYALGYTGVSIANDLKSRGVRTKEGKYLNVARIYKLIKNPKFIGQTIHNGKVYTNIYPAIIDEQTWQKVQDVRNTNKHAHGRKKEVYNFILSGKLVCGHCHHLIVGESGTSETTGKHYYYNCLSRRRKKAVCNFHAVKKQWLEDLVIQTTWQLLKDKNQLDEIANMIYHKHQNLKDELSNVKALEMRKSSAEKAVKNLITALEQGIITEQTKTRLQELEKEIMQYDFEIEQEKQRTYTYLTLDMIKNYLYNVIPNDSVHTISARKHIVKLFIREIIFDNHTLTITYNFTDNNPSKQPLDEINEVITISNSSNNQESLAPIFLTGEN